MADEPENIVLQQLRVMRAEISQAHAQLREQMKSIHDEVRGDMRSLRADIASDLLAMQAKNDAEHKATREQIVGLRRAVVEYHTAVLGHGVLISDLESGLRRLEQKAGASDS